MQKIQRRKGDMEKRKAFNVFVLYLGVIVLLSACGNSTTEEKTGTLELTIGGLTGVDASVTVTGPNSFNQSVKASSKLANLAVGDYTITAQDIVQTDTYFPDKREQSVVIKAGETSSVTLVYSKQNPNAGSLEVTINGLPSGTNADVTVAGANGFSQLVTTSGVLSNLTPGNYQLTAKTVTAGSDSYTPTPESQAISVVAGNKATITVTYGKQIPTLGQLAISVTGLPTDLNAKVSIRGPNNFSETLTASKTFENLSPGDYEITASQVEGDYTYRPYPPTQKVNVVAGERKDAPLGYVPTILPDKGEGAFSVSVAVDGDIMVVGAPAYDSPTQNFVGAAYLYRRAASGEWIFRKLLVPPFESTGAGVGQSVAVSGDTVVVGASRAITSQTCDSGGQNCINIVRGGLAYVFN
jgi:FG-GAP repeat